MSRVNSQDILTFLGSNVIIFRERGRTYVEDKSLDALIEFLRGYKGARWDEMPDLELYMDQVITYLKRLLAPFQDSAQENLITPSIINNYVKAGFVPRPQRKKYARAHLASLTMACTLKRVLPIESVKRLIERGGAPLNAERYDQFQEAQREAFLEEAQLLEQLKADWPSDTHSLYRLATHFALRAGADRLIADRIMAIIAEKAAGSGAAIDAQPAK